MKALPHSRSSRQGIIARWAPHRLGLCLAAGVVLIVLGWRVWVIARQPPRLISVAAGIGSAALIAGDIFPNSDGSRLVYSQQTLKGEGCCFHDVGSGRSRLLAEQKEKGYSWQKFGMLGWSPDDKLFAYAYPPRSPKLPEEQVVICNGLSGDAVAAIPVDPGILQLAWLSPDSFAYLTYQHDVSVWERKPEGAWFQSHLFKAVTKGHLDSDENYLTATSARAVAWKEEGRIWWLDIDASAPACIWESTTNQLEAFGYDKAFGLLILACRDDQGWLKIWLHPPATDKAQGAVQYVTRTDDRSRYASLQFEEGHNVFYFQTDANSRRKQWDWEGGVRRSSPAYDLVGTGRYLYDGALYFIGNQADEPPGIWRYDIDQEKVRCLVSTMNRDFNPHRVVSPMSGVLTNRLGAVIRYLVWQPRTVVAGRKYPIILCQTPYLWFSFPHLAAYQGYFFGLVQRPAPDDRTIVNWPDDVTALYNELARNPAVDTNRVFLYASTAEAHLLNQLAAEKPGFFKGAILLSPLALPELSDLPGASLFIAAGEEEDNGKAVKRLASYQDAACARGIPVRLFIQKGTQYVARSITTERDRVIELAKYLHEN
jgi:hypothetical protein